MDGFRDRLLASARRSRSWLCVGLDPDPERYPKMVAAEETADFLLETVQAVAPVACAVKLNAAFFEALGDLGHSALTEVMAGIPNELPIILDGKRNDVGHSAAKYAEAAFDELGADAVTVNPYLGRDTVEPFARYADKGVFLLARTSNPSAGDFQDLDVGGGTRLYEAVARKAAEWDKAWGNLGLVAGATYPDDLRRLRAAAGPNMPFLIPGAGTQGGDAAMALKAGADPKGRFALVNVGRDILYASKEEDWPAKVREAATRYAKALPAQA